MNDFGYVVVFNDDDKKPIIKDKIYTTLLDAEKYADSIAPDRKVRIYPSLNVKEPDGGFTCNDVDKMAQLVEDIRMLFLFDFEDAGTAPKASLHICKAYNHMSNAVYSLKLAHLEQTQATI